MDQLRGDKSALLTIPDAYDFAGERKIPAIRVEGDGANRPAMSDASDTIPSRVLENLDFAGFPADCEPLPVRAPGRARRSGQFTRDWDGLIPHDVPEDALKR